MSADGGSKPKRASRTNNVQHLKLPPHSVEAEQSLLGGLMLDCGAWPQAASVAAEDFFRADHRLIFGAIVSLQSGGKAFDAVVVADYLDQRGELGTAGGLAYIARLVRETPTSANVPTYAQIVRERSAQRRLKEIGETLISSATNGDGAAAALTRAQEELRRLRGFIGVEPATPAVVLKSATQLAEKIVRTWWLLKPYLERNASVLIYGDAGTFKSFLALLWSLEVAIAGQPVVYLSAEGKGLGRRIKGYAMHRWGSAWERELANVALFGIERPLNLSAAATVADLTMTLEAGAIKPAMIVIDTLSKNSDGAAERSNEDANAYLGQIDRELRERYEATTVLIHHCGHEEKKRARGPYSFMSNTDANFRVERPDLDKLQITVHSGRMKDTESPAAFALEGKIVDLGDVEEDGKPITTLVLIRTDHIAVASKPARPTGKRQQQLLAELERRYRVGERSWSEAVMREAGRTLGMPAQSSRDAIAGLLKAEYLWGSVANYTLKYPPAEGTK